MLLWGKTICPLHFGTYWAPFVFKTMLHFIIAYKCCAGATYVFLSQTEEPAKASTCARDRRALQQLALNVHVKHSDLT